jgi:hypothetical protein
MAPRTDSAVKVSPELAATLAELPDRAVVRVVLMLDLPARSVPRRLTPGERSQLLAETRRAANALLTQLKPTLDALGAVRVDAGGLTPLGGVVLDLPAGRVASLAQARQVRSILSDQPLAPPERNTAVKRP